MYNCKYPFKRKVEEDLTTERKKAHVITVAEIGVMWPE